MQRNIVYICSPFRRNYQQNRIKANLYSRFAYEKGCLPITPHAIFPQFLDDEKKSERKAGMEMGLQLLDMCNELWVFGLKFSDGMKAEIEKAQEKGISVRYFSEDMEDG